jgi:two-component system, chemotaxis family, chemotaxis protein CheY
VLKGLRILVVEDLKSIRDLVSRLLGGLGCDDVHQAEDLASARTKLDQFGFDAVLLDYDLAGENGLSLLAELRQNTWHFNRLVPVILLTGHKAPDLVEDAMAAGANAYLVKPVMPDLLGRRIIGVREKAGWVRPPDGGNAPQKKAGSESGGGPDDDGNIVWL